MTDTLVARTGLVGVNTNNPAFGLDVVGTAQLSGTATVTGIATLGDGSNLATSAAQIDGCSDS